MTDMFKKFRGYYHFIKKQQKHREAFGVHPVRAVLVETIDEARGKRLMELATHPLVCGTSKRSGLFWFTISPLFTDSADGSSLPRYLAEPDLILDSVWALPDRTKHSLPDGENSLPCPSISPSPSVAR